MIKLTNEEFKQIVEVCLKYDDPLKVAESRGWIFNQKKICPMCHCEMESDRIVCEACEFDERS